MAAFPLQDPDGLQDCPLDDGGSVHPAVRDQDGQGVHLGLRRSADGDGKVGSLMWSAYKDIYVLASEMSLLSVG